MDTKTAAHVGIELAVIGGVCYYLSNRNKELKNKVSELEQRVIRMERAVESIFNKERPLQQYRPLHQQYRPPQDCTDGVCKVNRQETKPRQLPDLEEEFISNEIEELDDYEDEFSITTTKDQEEDKLCDSMDSEC